MANNTLLLVGLAAVGYYLYKNQNPQTPIISVANAPAAALPAAPVSTAIATAPAPAQAITSSAIVTPAAGPASPVAANPVLINPAPAPPALPPVSVNPMAATVIPAVYQKPAPTPAPATSSGTAKPLPGYMPANTNDSLMMMELNHDIDDE